MATVTTDFSPSNPRRLAAERYTRVAITLHWLIALAIAYNLLSGLAGDLLPRGFFVLHVSSGLTILLLTVVRIAWRLTHRPPPLLPMKAGEARLAHVVHFFLYAGMVLLPLSGWAMISASPPAGSPGAAYAEVLRARRHPPAGNQVPASHAGANAPAAQAAGPNASHRRQPPMFWGLVRVPLIAPLNAIGRDPAGVPRQHAIHERLETAHYLGGWLMLALALLHIAGALKHQWIDGEPELARMGLGGTRRR